MSENDKNNRYEEELCKHNEISLKKVFEELFEKYVQKGMINKMIDDAVKAEIALNTGEKTNSKIDETQYEIYDYEHEKPDIILKDGDNTYVYEFKCTKGANPKSRVGSKNLINQWKNIKNEKEQLRYLLKINDCKNEIDANGVSDFLPYDFENKEYELKCNLEDILKERGMSQKWLREKTGITRSTLSNIIKNPNSSSAYNLFKIAKILNISVEEICDLDEID